MSFRFDIGARARSTGRLIGDVRDDLIEAALRKVVEAGWDERQLAEFAGMSPDDLERRLSGQDELTIRFVADLAWALNKEVSIEFREPKPYPGQNSFGGTSTAASGANGISRLKREAGRSSTKAVRTFVAKPSMHDEK